MSVERICIICGKHFFSKEAEVKRRAVQYCSRECYFNRPIKGFSNKDGYIIRYGRGSKTAYEHRIIASQISNLSHKVVHHIDGNRANNLISNIQILSQSDHVKLHARERLLKKGANPDTEKICRLCKRILPKTEFSPTSSNGKPILSSTCKQCCATEQRERRRQNKLRNQNNL